MQIGTSCISFLPLNSSLLGNYHPSPSKKLEVPRKDRFFEEIQVCGILGKRKAKTFKVGEVVNMYLCGSMCLSILILQNEGLKHAACWGGWTKIHHCISKKGYASRVPIHLSIVKVMVGHMACISLEIILLETYVYRSSLLHR